jgi:hypothetical protein
MRLAHYFKRMSLLILALSVTFLAFPVSDHASAMESTHEMHSHCELESKNCPPPDISCIEHCLQSAGHDEILFQSFKQSNTFFAVHSERIRPQQVNFDKPNIRPPITYYVRDPWIHFSTQQRE